MQAYGLGLLIFIFLGGWFLFNTLKILKQYERGLIFTLGKVSLEHGVKGPGLIVLLPGIQKMVRVSLRTVTMDVPSQDVITKDNVTVKVNAVVYFRVIDPRKAIVEVEDFYYATSLIAQTTLRSILGQNTLDDLLSNREAINVELQKVIDEQTEPWGVKVTTVEVKNVDLPGRDAARYCNPGAGRAGTPGQDHPCRRRAPGIGEAGRSRGGHQPEPDRASASLSPDPHRDRHREKYNHRISPADRYFLGVLEAGG